MSIYSRRSRWSRGGLGTLPQRVLVTNQQLNLRFPTFGKILLFKQKHDLIDFRHSGKDLASCHIHVLSVRLPKYQATESLKSGFYELSPGFFYLENFRKMKFK